MAAAIGNKYAIGNNGGRPLMYQTAEELQAQCDAYFIYIEGEKQITKKGKKEIIEWVRYPEPATVTGLTLYLGFSDRGSLDDYEKKQEFSHIIKKARARVEHEYEKRLHGDRNVGAIFALKNMGWKDNKEIDLSSKNKHTLEIVRSNTAPSK